MNEDQNSKVKALDRLAEAMVEDILSATDAEILAEAKEDGIHPDAVTARWNHAYEQVLVDLGIRHPTPTKTAVDADRNGQRLAIVKALDPTAAQTQRRGRVPKRGTPRIWNFVVTKPWPFLAVAGVACLALLVGVFLTFGGSAPSPGSHMVFRLVSGDRIPITVEKSTLTLGSKPFEELFNFLAYRHSDMETIETPFEPSVSVMPAPWNDAAQLMRIGIKGHVPKSRITRRANLVFLIDTSESMDQPNKLPLLVGSLEFLVGTLAPEDTVAFVTYAETASTTLPPTHVAQRGPILAALERLEAGGSTVGDEGFRQAYLVAEQHFVEGGINRVILATDGDFSAGIANPDELEGYVARKRAGGVFLSVLGFGMGDYDDELMQHLAQSGNGNVAFIDSLSTARMALVEASTSAPFPIAKDVNIQVKFNPAAFSGYRLIGYTTPKLTRHDFRSHETHAGEIASELTVTAIFEVTRTNSGAGPAVSPRFRPDAAASEPDREFSDELAFVKIRYKRPGGDPSFAITRAVTSADVFDALTADLGESHRAMAAAAAGFGQVLLGTPYIGAYTYDDVVALAEAARRKDPSGPWAELISSVRYAESLSAMALPPAL